MSGENEQREEDQKDDRGDHHPGEMRGYIDKMLHATQEEDQRGEWVR